MLLAQLTKGPMKKKYAIKNSSPDEHNAKFLAFYQAQIFV